MRIGISTSVVQRGKTGVAQYVCALLRALLPYAVQHQFTLFVLEQDVPLFEFVGDGMQLVLVAEQYRPAVKNIWWHQAQLPRLARQHQLEVLHVPSYRRLLWPKPCALVATIHDLAPFRVPKKYDWKRMLYGRVVVRRLAWRQDAIVAISRNTAQDITAFFGLPPGRLTVIHNGIDHVRFFPEASGEASTRIRQHLGLPRPFFLYVARLEHPGKNHVRLIAAFEQFKAATGSEWQLVLGGADWHGAEAIHAAIRQSSVAQDIRCLGFVPEDQLPGLYRAAGALVYPSLYEGFGLPPLEAMACGCPVICSARGSLGEVVGEAAAIIDPEDIPGLAGQLHLLATDAAIRNRLRTAGLDQARKFDWNQTAATTLRVYEKVKFHCHRLPFAV